MREKFITRTITVTTAIYVCTDLSSMSVEQKTADLIGDFTPTDALVELKEMYETNDFKVVAVMSTAKAEFKCKLPEKKFFIHSEHELITD